MSNQALALKVIELFNDRKGFDWWWQSIAEEDQHDIAEELAELLRKENE